MASEVKLNNRALDALGFEARSYLNEFVQTVEDLNYLASCYYNNGEPRGVWNDVYDAVFHLRGVIEQMTC